MAEHSIENEELKILVSDHGGELVSLVKKETGQEYIWNADKAFWGRHAPVLFPIVGGLRENIYRFGGREYRLGQHGFARDMEFELASKTENEIWHRLVSNEATREQYPFDFELETGFRLFRNQVIVLWRVQNRSEGEMYFSIGGHPAFLLPPQDGAAGGKEADRQKEEVFPAGTFLKSGNGQEKKEDMPEQGRYKLLFEGVSMLNTRMLENGLACRRLEQLELTRCEVEGKQYGAAAVTEHFFDRDAYIIEGHQTREVALAGTDGSPRLSVKFDAPLFGVWAPKGNAPFVCIEPWYGRCDGVDADQSLEDKEYINRLEPGQVFSKNYRICIY